MICQCRGHRVGIDPIASLGRLTQGIVAEQEERYLLALVYVQTSVSGTYNAK
jgi:hypothetical protein